jgi:hypothetical protein
VSMGARFYRESSPRRRGPITTGVSDEKRSLPHYLNETTRRMGPRLRGDDVLKHGRASLLPPPLRGRAGEGGSPELRSLWLIDPKRPRLWLTPLPPLLRSVDLLLKGEGKKGAA